MKIKMDINRYNIKWVTQSKNSGESMPCGGFDTGANVWVENNEVMMYIDRSGSFDENNQMLKLGRFRFKFSINPFEKSFSQELDLEKGFLKICGDELEMIIWFDTSRPVCHIDIHSGIDIEVSSQYEGWRTEERELLYGEIGTGERQAAASYVCYPGKVITYPDEITNDNESITFYHKNRNDKLLIDFLVKQQNLSEIEEELFNPQKDLTFGGKLTGKDCEFMGVTVGSYAGINYKGYSLKSNAGRKHSFYICFNTEQTPSVSVWQNNLNSLCKSALADLAAREKSEKWWLDFWDRSFIYINMDKDDQDIGYQISRNYALFRYMLGCNAYGDYPTKFNGGLFTTDACYSVGEGHTFVTETSYQNKTPDFRMWGGGSFTAQNQRLVYWPMLKNGDFDMMPAQFDFYNRLLKNAELRTKHYWEHQGCSFAEQLENMGLPIGWTWGYEDSPWDAFRRPKNYDRTELKCPSTKYEYSTQLEFAFMIIKYYRYTKQDISKYITFIESCITFYFEHYEKIHRETAVQPYDANGKLVIFPSTALETYKDALNPTDAVAGLKAILLELIHLEEYVDVEYYKELIKKIPDIKIGSVDGTEVLLPAYSWTHVHNVEMPELYPVFPYEIYGFGRENLELAINTWKTAPASQKNYISWHQDGIFTARLGLTEEAKAINIKKLQNSGRRFPAFWGPGHDWVPDHNWGGSGMIGLQDMLVQQYDNRIYLFPAWPVEWDVSFKLHLYENVILEASLKNGKVEYRLTPEGFDTIVKTNITI